MTIWGLLVLVIRGWYHDPYPGTGNGDDQVKIFEFDLIKIDLSEKNFDNGEALAGDKLRRLEAAYGHEGKIDFSAPITIRKEGRFHGITLVQDDPTP
jgi:hypothetical protein